MHYTCISVTCQQDFREILMAEIAEAGFDTMLETGTGFEAYTEGDHFDKESIEEIKKRYRSQTSCSFVFSQIEKKNWNEEWEKNYEPVIVDDSCIIRAEFHKPARNFPYDIIITPKMSFGTGHHQTTRLMIRSQLIIDHLNKHVMDAGCGTAVLSIMASKLGATNVKAFDIDEWSVLNSKENVEINHCENIDVFQGKINELNFKGTFDIILANINKNVLLEDMPVYRKYLDEKGILLLSGFYKKDISELIAKAISLQLKETHREILEDWAALTFTTDNREQRD